MSNFAASRQVNPPGASPKLTEAQVWAGLEMNFRDPLPFIPRITSCEILSDTGEKIVRKIKQIGQPESIEQAVNIYKGTIAYLDTQPNGLRVTNVLSYDKDNELVLTLSFAGAVPGIKDLGNSPSAADLNKVVGEMIEQVIVKIRELVKEGTLKA